MSGLSAFVFGKLPAHGDFVSRGLDAAARDAWDGWISAGLAQARAALGERFEAAHEAAPPWRFAFGAPAYGPGRQAGAFAPSADRAGRRFLVLAGARADAGLDPDGAGAAVAEALEETIYQAFQDGLDADGLLARVQAAVDAIDAGSGAIADGAFWTAYGADADRPIAAQAPPADLLTRVLAG